MLKQPDPILTGNRKRLEGQVLQQVNMFDRLADPLLQITGRKGRIKWANQAAYDLLGPDILDKRLHQYFGINDLKTAIRSLRKQEQDEGELIIRPKILPDQEFRVRLLRLERKTVYGARVLVSLTDVTEVLKLQTQRANFVANASHELKTPVAALSGFIETLETDRNALETFLPLMAREARRMRELIGSLLNLTKTEMQVDIAPKHWATIHPLIQQATDGLEYEFQQRQQTLNLDQAPPAVEVRHDPSALVMVFTNILQNASKYAPTGSSIFIYQEAKDGQLHIHIRDQGPGIAPEHIPHLTERFYRVDEGTAHKNSGTGLGLAIVKHILIRHRGQLSIQSTTGQGATFTVSLPYRSLEKAEQSGTAEA